MLPASDRLAQTPELLPPEPPPVPLLDPVPLLAPPPLLLPVAPDPLPELDPLLEPDPLLELPLDPPLLLDIPPSEETRVLPPQLKARVKGSMIVSVRMLGMVASPPSLLQRKARGHRLAPVLCASQVV